MDSRGPIFVIGNPRSGTTLLRLMLTCHPRICIPPEAGFALWLEPTYADWQKNDPRLGGFLDALFDSRKFETWELDREALALDIARQSPVDYASLIGCVYSHYSSHNNPGWTTWGDKNNSYVTHVARLHRLFPGARFVHIVRDPRDIACSYLELSKAEHSTDYQPRLSDDIHVIARQWKHNICQVERDFGEIGDSLTHCLRFEDLVVHPVDTLVALCGFLDEPFDPLMLNYHEENANLQLEPPDFLSWKQLTLSPLQTNRVGRYRSDLSEKKADLIVSQTEPVFSRYYGDRA